MPALVLILTLAPLGFADSAVSNDWSHAYNLIHWTRFTTASGLPSPVVLDVFEHPGGGVYASTPLGLASYNGYEWRTISDLPQAAVQSVAFHPDGRLVVTTAAGIYWGKDLAFSRHPYRGPGVILLGVSPGGKLQVRTGDSFAMLDGATVQSLSGGQIQRFSPSIALSTMPQSYRKEQLLQGMGPELSTALYSLPPRTMIQLDAYAANSAGEAIVSIGSPREASGVWHWGPGRPARRIESLGRNRVRLVQILESGAALAMETSRLIWIRNNGKWTQLDPPPPQVNGATVIRAHAQGGWWIGTDHGLYLYRPDSGVWRQVPVPAAGYRLAVNDFLKARDGSMWLATGGGAVRLRPDGRTEVTTSAAGTLLSTLTGVVEDPSGNIWFSSGSAFDGAVRFDGHSWKAFGRAEGLGSGPVHRMYRTRDGRIWFLRPQGSAKSPGVVSFTQNGKFEQWGPPGGFPNGIYAMTEAPDGTLWFGGLRVLARWNGQWTVFDTRKHPAFGRRWFTIAADRQGNVWFADRRAGLWRMDRSGAIKEYRARNGLVSDEVFEITIDDQDTAWVSTVMGLSAIRQGQIERFSSSSGLRSNSIWPVKQVGNEVCVGHMGGGLSCLDRSYRDLPLAKATLDPPSLRGNAAVVHWTASSLWARIPEEVIETRFRLDKGKWSEWGMAREANVLGLGPGPHRVQVQARAPFGPPNLRGHEVAFTLPPPFYRTTVFGWAVFVSALLFAAAIHTILERRRALAGEIQRKERRFRALIENSYDCVMLFNRRSRVDYVTPSFERLTGHRPEKIVGRTGLTFIHPEDLDRVRSAFSLLRESPGASASLRFRFRLASGEYHWIEAVIVNLLHDPDVRAMVYTSRDIHDRVQAEEAAAAAQRQAEEASLAKSDFLATMSHEIRTPMNGILGMTELLASGSLQPEQRNQCEVILRSGTMLLRIINDILDLSRIERGAVELESAPFDLREVFSAVEDLLRPGAESKRIQLMAHYPESAPSCFLGDAGRVQQILLNLAGNSLKFTEKGSVGISLQCQPCDVPAKMRLRIEVRDTGIGIPPEKLDAVFSRFVQADASTTRRYGGSGLGLAITKLLVGLMGGKIEVQSVVGVGSVFSVHLDLPLAPSLDRQPTHNSAFAPLALRVLLVEDNRVNRLVAERMLHRFGCHVEVAENGVQAVARFKQGQFDLILMDCHMPEMDGFEATRLIRERESQTGTSTPIVALTANAMAGHAEACAAAGMDGFLSKPLALAELHRTVAAYARQPMPASKEAAPSSGAVPAVHYRHQGRTTRSPETSASELPDFDQSVPPEPAHSVTHRSAQVKFQAP
ncbi:MAG: response regulator [Bryobacterales bacterium]|nr:response regulator [Bryobacterales bacterium]